MSPVSESVAEALAVADQELAAPNPVSERDFDIFEAIAVRLEPLPQVARQFGLAAITIRDIVRRTEHKLACQRAEQIRRTRAGTIELAYDRMQHQVHLLHQAFAESKATIESEHTSRTRSYQEYDGIQQGPAQICEREWTTRRKGRANERLVTAATKIIERLAVLDAQLDELAADGRAQKRVAADAETSPLTPDPSPPRGEGRKVDAKPTTLTQPAARVTAIDSPESLAGLEGWQLEQIEAAQTAYLENRNETTARALAEILTNPPGTPAEDRRELPSGNIDDVLRAAVTRFTQALRAPRDRANDLAPAA